MIDPPTFDDRGAAVPPPPEAPPAPATGPVELSDAAVGAPVAIAVEDLSVDYRAHRWSPPVQALTGVTFDVAVGTTTAVIGESGSGKSTLARVLGELRRGSRFRIVGGDARILGHAVRDASAARLDRLRLVVGFLEQDAATRLDGQLTVAENIGQPILLRDKRWDRRDLEYRAAALLDRVHLPLTMMHRFPYELSSGQRQRVAIARSLVLEPSVWIADEPGRGVDATLADLVPELIATERGSRPFSAVVVSHELAFGAGIDQIVVLERGAVIGLSTPDRLFDEADHPFVIALRGLTGRAGR